MVKSITIISILFLLSSCWPSSVSLTDSGSMPPEWKTFSVKTLENNAPNAPLNYPVTLSERLKDGIQNNTRLLLNSEQGKGEIVIEGIITNYTITPVALQQGDNAEKNRLTISVQFTIFVNSPKEETMNLISTRFIDYSSSTDLAGEEANLLDEISTQVIQDVVNKLLSNW